MALKTIVKVGSVNSLSDARYCAGMGVEYIGYNTDKTHEQYLSPENYTEIKGWVTGVKWVKEAPITDQETTSEFKEINTLGQLSDSDAPVFLSLTAEEANANSAAIIDNNTKIKYLILEGSSDAVQANDIALIEKLSAHVNILLGFGVESNNVLSLLDQTKISGIALKGSQEIRPGFKDYDELADILEALDID